MHTRVKQTETIDHLPANPYLLDALPPHEKVVWHAGLGHELHVLAILSGHHIRAQLPSIHPAARKETTIAHQHIEFRLESKDTRQTINSPKEWVRTTI